MTAHEYYGNPDVRARVFEFCGATPGRDPTAAYLAVLDPSVRDYPTWDHASCQPPDAAALTGGHDVACSLWDSSRLVFLLEIDYQNTDHPDDAFRHPADMLVALEPVFQAVRATLSRLDLRVRIFASGRGYHFVGAIPLERSVIDRLAGLVPETPVWWPGVEARRPTGVTATMTVRQARAAEGLGLLLEHAGHLSLRTARRASPLPVVFNGTMVGSGLNGRAAVSIDFSHVGDPLDARHVRAAFSTYQWHRMRPDIFGPDVARLVPALAVVPREGVDLGDAITRPRTLEAGARMAALGNAVLPDISTGVLNLLDSYTRSALARFHRGFLDRVTQVNPVEPRALPACAARALDEPNDLLLQPAFVQHLTRLMLSRGWSAPSIAATVRSRYEADHHWGDHWARRDPAMRAAFDVRVFAGMVAAGLDSLVDFNCVSAQDKDLCPRADCPLDLRRDRARLRHRPIA